MSAKISISSGSNAPGESAEPEDHVAILMDVMASAARGDFDIDLEGQKRFFETHLKPWAIRFFADLETAKEGRFYRAVGRVGRVYLELEAEAFALPN